MMRSRRSIQDNDPVNLLNILVAYMVTDLDRIWIERPCHPAWAIGSVIDTSGTDSGTVTA